jgi:RimJ/RimL family protein N-acetyltransferase
MEKCSAELTPLSVADAPFIYSVLRRYRAVDPSLAAERSYPDWLANIYPQQDHFSYQGSCPVYVSLGQVDWVNRSASFGVFCEEPGCGDGVKAASLLFDHAFNTLGLHRLTCFVLGNNKMCLSAIAKVGPLRLEGVVRESTFRAGRFVDQHIFGILCEDWRKR